MNRFGTGSKYRSCPCVCLMVSAALLLTISVTIPDSAIAQDSVSVAAQTNLDFACGLERDGCSREVSTPIIGVARAPALFNDVQLATHEFLATAIDFNKDKLKLVVTPFKLSAQPSPLSSLSFNLAGGDGTYTAGAGWGYDPTNPLGNRGRGLVREVFSTVRAASGDEIENPESYLKDTFRPAYGRYYKRLLQNAFGYSVAANLILFEEVAGREVDRDEEGVIDNEHTIKGYTLTPSFTYNLDYRTAASGSYYYSRRRAGAAADDSLGTYHGLSLSLAYRALLLNPEFWQSNDFVTDFFLPSVDIGMSWEMEWCTEPESACEDAIKEQWAFTPYVNIRASPKAQFRLGLSMRRSTLVTGEDGTSVGPLLQYMLQFGPPK